MAHLVVLFNTRARRNRLSWVTEGARYSTIRSFVTQQSSGSSVQAHYTTYIIMLCLYKKKKRRNQIIDQIVETERHLLYCSNVFRKKEELGEIICTPEIVWIYYEILEQLSYKRVY